jgi:pimeloyl-ACP methyl ester carboxylesterase
MRRSLSALTTVALLIAGLPASAAAHPHRSSHRPVVFVHGFAGSGLQFETQAKRLASNGYPAEIIEAHDYDSTFAVETTDQVFARLDERIARLLAETGADRVDLLGHSLGTTLSHAYLATPARAATVAHYVNLDGRTATAPPGGVPTLAVWGEGPATREIGGSTNVYFPNQSHTQVVTSPETFTEIFRFFTGRAPRTTTVLPEPPGHLRVSGRAVLFPTNVGVTGARLEIYEVDAATGHRRHARPAAAFPLAGDGSWGPFRARGWVRYEFAIVRDGAATHHLYFPPFRRTDRLVRLLSSLPGEGLAGLTETSEQHTNLVVSRNKEWWGAEGDELLLNGVNVLNAANSPRPKRVIGIFVYDRGVDAVTDLSAPIPVFFAQPFITGLDAYLPAAPAGRGTVSVVVHSRTGGTADATVPNWPSRSDRISIQIDD